LGANGYPLKWREVHQKAFSGEVSSADDDPYFRDDGIVEWTRWECRPWYETDHSIVGFIVYTEVIAQRKKMELELKADKEKAEESDKLKIAFLQNMSHELLTPLNAFSGFAGILNKPNWPIVAQSAYALDHERAKYEGIFDDYLTKPINGSVLKKVVAKYIEIQNME